eukprot:618554-Rhodomonas_salina.2
MVWWCRRGVPVTSPPRYLSCLALYLALRDREITVRAARQVVGMEMVGGNSFVQKRIAAPARA